MLNGHKLLLLLAPRAHAKSTVVTIHYPLWRICMDPNQSILLAGASVDVARLALRSIKAALEQNECLRAGFGSFKSEDPATWTQTEIVIHRDDCTLKDPTIMAVGVGGSILTRRVSNGLFVADDVVQDDEAESEVARRKLRNWFFGVLMNVREPEDQGVVIGTRKADNDLYSELLANPAFHSVVYNAVAQEEGGGKWTKALWVEKWPLESLEARHKEIGSIQFDRNYRNIVLGDAN